MTWHACERLSVIIPIIDDASCIPALVEDVFAAIPASMLAEVILVDDAGNEAGRQAQAKLLARFPGLRILRHVRSSGESASLRTGVRFATGELIAVLDPCGGFSPADIPRISELLINSGPGTALASVVAVKSGRAAHEPAGAQLEAWLRRRLLGTPDHGPGLMVFWRSTFLDLPYFSGMHRVLPELMRTYGHSTVNLPMSTPRAGASGPRGTSIAGALLGIYDLMGIRWLASRTRLTPVSEVNRSPAVEAGNRRNRHDIDAEFGRAPHAIVRPSLAIVEVHP